MTIEQMFYSVIKKIWPRHPEIRKEALEGLKYAAKVMEGFNK